MEILVPRYFVIIIIFCQENYELPIFIFINFPPIEPQESCFFFKKKFQGSSLLPFFF